MLDQNAYPHIVDAIADAAAAQHASALAIRPVCRRFCAKADAALARHLRIERGPSADSRASADDTTSSADDASGPLLILTASGAPLPRLYPSSSPLSRLRNADWHPALKTALAQTLILDFRVSPKYSELHGGSRTFIANTVRLIGVNDFTFEIDAVCRRLVTMVAVGVPDRDWARTLPHGFTPIWQERLVINYLLPERAGGGHTNSLWDLAHCSGEDNITYIFRPVDIHVASGAAVSRVEPDFGALLNAAIGVLDNQTSSTYTLVGLEELSWDRIGIPEPENVNGEEVERSKEAWFRASLEEMIVPVLGIEKAMVDIEDIQSRITFLSHAEYRARVGEEEYEGDLIPLERLFDRFAV